MGAPPPPPKKKRTGCITAGCAVLAGLLVIGFIYNLMTGRSTTTTSTTATSGTGGPTTTATPDEGPKPGSQWTYGREEDAMAKGTVAQASVRSTNTVNFRFPYAGPQHATLTLRTHPRYGKDLIFNIEKGQLLCRSYDGCQVLVRFDEGPSVNYAAAAPEDNSTETIFIRDYAGFVAKMLKAKKVRISVNVYQEGAPVFEFDVSHFDENRYKR